MAKLLLCAITFSKTDGQAQARGPVSFKTSSRKTHEVLKEAAEAIGAAGSTPAEFAKHNVLHIYCETQRVFDARAKTEPDHVIRRHRSRKDWRGYRPIALVGAFAAG